MRKLVINIQEEPKAGTQQKDMEGENMANIVFIIAQHQFRDEELFVPKKIFENAGYHVRVASITRDECDGMIGGKYTPELTVNDIDVDMFDAIVVAGGMGSPELADHKEVIRVLNSAYEKKKVVASICLAGMVLAKAGLLRGRDATVYKTDDSLKALEEGEATYVEKDVVVDERIITASGPEAAKEFAETILKKLQ